MEINSLEFFVLALWGVGVAAGLWIYLSGRSLQSILLSGASVMAPVLGSVAAMVLSLGRYRALRKSQGLGKPDASLTAK